MTGLERVRRKMDLAKRAAILEQRQGIATLMALSTTAPLAGCLLSLMGVIRSFKGCPCGEGPRFHPELYAVGLAEAMLPVLWGLAIAIPTWSACRYFDQCVQRVAAEMDIAASEVVAFLEDDCSA
jgi:biopolymer transport protein ExbB/TolQ